MAKFSSQQDSGADEPFLLVGLGNPGTRYASNRHNVGFLVVDELAGRVGGRFKRHKAGADVLEGRLGAPGQATRVTLVKPHSYMNLSGGPVTAAARFFGVPPNRVVVSHDELDLDYGAVRLKLGGGDNGHNGLRSITKSLGTPDYLRVRFGVGRPPGRMDAAQYVLKDFASTERRELGLHIDTCADAVETLVTSGLAAAQNSFHTR